MYTYERLLKLCGQESNDAMIAHYFLTHLDSLDKMSVKTTLNQLGISKATLHRFYSKGGYENFKDLTNTLSQEVKQKQRFNVSFHDYKDHMQAYPQQVSFDDIQIKALIKALKNAKKVAFYGEPWQMSCFKRLFFYLVSHHIDILFLDQWDIKEMKSQVENLSSEDAFIMVDTNWTIQGIYENSLNTKHILNLDMINQLPCKKFFIGDGNYNHYLNYSNIYIKLGYDYMPYIPLNILDQKLLDMLEGD